MPRSRRRRRARGPSHGGAVDHRAVQRAEVDEAVAVGLGADLGVAPGGEGVARRQGRSRRAARARVCSRRARCGGRRAGRARRPGRPAPSLIAASTSRSPRFRVSSTSSTVTGPDEVVALVAGVLAGLLGQLALEDVGVVVEALDVLRAEAHDEVVGRDRPPARRSCGRRPSRGSARVRSRPAGDRCGRPCRRCPPPAARADARSPGLPRSECTERPSVDRVRAATLSHSGRVAELADAQASGACVRKDVGVQVPPRPRWVAGRPIRTGACSRAGCPRRSRRPAADWSPLR